MSVVELRDLARWHDEHAAYLAQNKDAGSIAKAANHFTVSDGLRRLARAAR